MRTDPVFIMKRVKPVSNPSRNDENGSSSVKFEFSAPGDYYEFDRRTVTCKDTLTHTFHDLFRFLNDIQPIQKLK